MRVREAAAAMALLATLWSPVAAQRTRDRPQLIFTISGAYIDGAGLWTVDDQVLDIGGPLPPDHLFLSRSVTRTIGAGFSATYYKGQNFGLTGETFLLGVGYDDQCRVLGTPNYTDNIERCTFIDERDRSAAAVTVSVGANYRIAPREFFSPFIHGSVGILVNNQSPIEMIGQTNRGSVLTIYDDDNHGTRLRPAFVLGVGSTIAISPAYQIRWEVRDNIVGVQAVTGPVDVIGTVPPNETDYKHLFSVQIGLDVVLERHRGRRY
jgi:hypothetical protein